jgi:DNA-binding NarL/FixJ family response regulator
VNAVANTELTERDIKVLQALADGESTENAGFIVDLHSAQAVKNRLRIIYIKLGADNRAHAVALCFRRGLIT